MLVWMLLRLFSCNTHWAGVKVHTGQDSMSEKEEVGVVAAEAGAEAGEGKHKVYDF